MHIVMVVDTGRERTKQVIIEFLIENWLEFHLSKHGSSMMSFFSNSFLDFVRGLCQASPEIQESEDMLTDLLSYLSQIKLVLDESAWKILFKEVGFSTFKKSKEAQRTIRLSKNRVLLMFPRMAKRPWNDPRISSRLHISRSPRSNFQTKEVWKC